MLVLNLNFRANCNVRLITWLNMFTVGVYDLKSNFQLKWLYDFKLESKFLNARLGYDQRVIMLFRTVG